MTDFKMEDRERLLQDLENLERRHTDLEYAALILKRSCFAFLAALCLLLVFALVLENAFAALVCILLLTAFGCGAYFLKGSQWIDAVGCWGGPFSLWGVKRSEAMAVEDMIEDRKARLAQLTD